MVAKNPPAESLPPADLSLILVFAFRYALGRMTYAPSAVQEAIRTCRGVFHGGDLSQMAEEISTAENNGSLGMGCDVRGWLEFRDWCLNEAGGEPPAPRPPLPHVVSLRAELENAQKRIRDLEEELRRIRGGE